MTIERTTQTTARIAGWFYLAIIVSSILSLVFLGGKFNVLGDSAASVAKMAQYGMLVRMNAAYEAVMFSAVIALAVLLFEMTRLANVFLARTALLLRVGEALLGFAGIILSLGILSLVEQSDAAAEINSLAVLLYNLKDITYKILMICISGGTMLFFMLFHKARMLPAFLTLWGIIGFALMIVASLLQILQLPAGGMVNAAAAVLAITFELTIGIWFIVKGINQSGPTTSKQ